MLLRQTGTQKSKSGAQSQLIQKIESGIAKPLYSSTYIIKSGDALGILCPIFI